MFFETNKIYKYYNRSINTKTLQLEKYWPCSLEFFVPEKVNLLI